MDLNSAIKMLIAAVNSTDRAFTDKEIRDIVKFHAIGAATASVASGWLPGAGSVIATTASAGFIWSMYIRIGNLVGCPFSKNILKTLATGIVTNLAGYLAATLAINTVLTFIPIAGNLAAATISGTVGYALTVASAIVYIKILTNIFKANKDPTKVDIETLKSMAKEAAKDVDIKKIYEESKEHYKEAKESGEYDDCDFENIQKEYEIDSDDFESDDEDEEENDEDDNDDTDTEQKNDDVSSRLKKLKELFDKGILDEDEYKVKKKELIDLL